jgi:hypothetical protein
VTSIEVARTMYPSGRSLDALKKQLGGCSHMAKKEFSATETQNIIKYLNDQFYQFC